MSTQRSIPQTKQDKRSSPHGDRLHILICRLNRQAHANRHRNNVLLELRGALANLQGATCKVLLLQAGLRKVDAIQDGKHDKDAEAVIIPPNFDIEASGPCAVPPEHQDTWEIAARAEVRLMSKSSGRFQKTSVRFRALVEALARARRVVLDGFDRHPVRDMDNFSARLSDRCHAEIANLSLKTLKDATTTLDDSGLLKICVAKGSSTVAEFNSKRASAITDWDAIYTSFKVVIVDVKPFEKWDSKMMEYFMVPERIFDDAASDHTPPRLLYSQELDKQMHRSCKNH